LTLKSYKGYSPFFVTFFSELRQKGKTKLNIKIFIMEAIIIVPVVFITFYLIIELLVHRRERLMMIEKFSQSQPFDLSQLNLLKGANISFSGLKIGCLLCGLGLGFLTSFLISAVLCDSIQGLGYWHWRDPLTLACILIFGGVGLIVAHLVERPKK
jgi:hypothetical protein